MLHTVSATKRVRCSVRSVRQQLVHFLRHNRDCTSTMWREVALFLLKACQHEAAAAAATTAVAPQAKARKSTRLWAYAVLGGVLVPFAYQHLSVLQKFAQSNRLVKPQPEPGSSYSRLDSAVQFWAELRVRFDDLFRSRFLA